jgi:hypothetical protein
MTYDLMGNREEALRHYQQIPENSRYRRSAKSYIDAPYNSFDEERGT